MSQASHIAHRENGTRGEAGAPRFIETVEDVLSAAPPTRAAAELIVAARKRLLKASDRLLSAKDLGEMGSIIADEMPDMEIAVQVVTMGLRVDGRSEPPSTTRLNFLEGLRSRGASDDVVDRIRLGLLAADDEARLLQILPGGIEAHPELWKEDAKGRFLLMTIAKWVGSEAPEPPIWTDLTYAFLDAAGRAYGLAAATVNEHAPGWFSKVA
jgi:hypothetical protein